jgi:hypothetical protein
MLEVEAASHGASRLIENAENPAVLQATNPWVKINLRTLGKILWNLVSREAETGQEHFIQRTVGVGRFHEDATVFGYEFDGVEKQRREAIGTIGLFPSNNAETKVDCRQSLSIL